MKRAAVAVKLGGERGGGNQWRGVIITRESKRKRKYKYKLQFKKDSNTNEGKFLYCNTTISLSDRWNSSRKRKNILTDDERSGDL